MPAISVYDNFEFTQNQHFAKLGWQFGKRLP